MQANVSLKICKMEICSFYTFLKLMNNYVGLCKVIFCVFLLDRLLKMDKLTSQSTDECAALLSLSEIMGTMTKWGFE